MVDVIKSNGGVSEESVVQPGIKLQVVPEYLKSFILTIAKTFYGPECYVVADYVQKNVCIKEEKLRRLLKFDPKSLKPFLTLLKVDKIVKERIVTEEVDGKQRKVSYYFINYKGAVNVTKYKLDQIRQKLETREKDEVTKSNYKCSGCSRTYEPMDVGKLYDPTEGKMLCWNCYGEVKDEETAGPKEDTRSSLAKFNEQTGPLVTIMQQLNGVIFADHILEPPVPKSENIVEEKPQENEPKKVLALGERAFSAVNTTFNTENMKLNLGDTIEILEPEKEAVPWLAGSVRVSLADIARREAAKKSRHYMRSMAKLNMMTGADDEEIDNLLDMEKDRISDFKKSKRPYLEEFNDILKRRINGKNGFVTDKRPRFSIGDEDEQQPMDYQENGYTAEIPLKRKRLSYADILRSELTVKFQGKKYLITEITEEMLENMTKKELERFYEAREKLIQMYFRCEW